jgi:hypothetical protein
MTWFASQIYAEPTPKVIAILSTYPTLSRGLYLLKGPLHHNWPNSNYVRHTFPADGLLVVREVCNPDQCKNPHTDRVEVDFHRENAISWANIDGPGEIDVILPLELPAQAGDKIITMNPTPSYPPKTLLRFLKHINMLTNTVITYYHHETYANWQYEQEFAWVFDTEDRVLVRYGNQYILQYTTSGASRITLDRNARSVLWLVLKPYGLVLPSDYFAPHTRDFDWSRYKLQSTLVAG